MKEKELSYKEAISQIKEILQSIEEGEPDVDELSNKLKRANELITFCKDKLHKAEKDIQKVVGKMDE